MDERKSRQKRVAQWVDTTIGQADMTDSRKHYFGKHLSPDKKHFLIKATLSNPLELPSTIRRGTYNLSSEERIGPQHRRAASDLVWKVRNEHVNEALGSPSTSGPKTVLLQISTRTCAYSMLRRHNAALKGEPTKFDDIICLGSQFDKGVVFTCYLPFPWYAFFFAV